MSIITQIMQEINEMMADLYNQAIQGEVDFSTCIKTISDTMRQLSVDLGEDLCTTIEESLFESPGRKARYSVHRSDDEKTISTLIGDIKLSRRYYKDKQTGEFCYLLDDFLSLTPHQRMDIDLEAAIYEKASKHSYQETIDSFEHIGIYSRQTVKNIVHKYSPDSVALPVEAKRQVDCLYIEADEDHVAYQDGKNREMRLAYVHEGYKENLESSDRKELNISRIFTGLYEDSEELWEDIYYYLDQQYDLAACPTLYLSGDGAHWIKKGLDYLPTQTRFVLDPYHTVKYLRQACVGISNDHLYCTLHRWLYTGEKGYLQDYFKVRLNDPSLPESSKQTLQKVRRYLIGNWDSIQRQRDPQYIGCSAEGHVSHWLSARLSSRPLGWSTTGAENIAKARAYDLNGGDLKTWVTNQIKTKERKRRVEKLDGRVGRKYARQYDWSGKVAILHYSNNTRSRQAFGTIAGY
ncbi:ISLre2 family transposase [Globicatella sanguinis]